MTQRQILSAAATLFAEKGYDSTSIDDIAAKADVAKGTLYYHFDSKESVVIALREESFSQMRESALENLARGEKPISILEKILLCRAQWTEKNPELTKVFFEQRIHQFLFREEDPLGLPGKPVNQLPAQQAQTKTNGKLKESKLANTGTFAELIKEIVINAQGTGDLRQDLSPTEITQMIMACFLHAQGSWIGGYSSTSLVDKVHRWFHAILDGLYA